MAVSNKIGLRSDRQLRDWVKLYKQLGPDEAFQDNRGKNLIERNKLRKMSLEEVTYLRAENDCLKKWLKK